MEKVYGTNRQKMEKEKVLVLDIEQSNKVSSDNPAVLHSYTRRHTFIKVVCVIDVNNSVNTKKITRTALRTAVLKFIYISMFLRIAYPACISSIPE